MNKFKKPFYMSSFRGDDFGDDFDSIWNNEPDPVVPPPRPNWNRRGKSRGYNQAYGDYQGGYGPGGGFGRRNPVPQRGPYGQIDGFFAPLLDDNIGPIGNFNLPRRNIPPRDLVPPRGGNWMGPPIRNFGPPLFGPRNVPFDNNYDDDLGPCDDFGDEFYLPGRGYGPDGPHSSGRGYRPDGPHPQRRGYNRPDGPPPKKGIYNRVHRYLTRCGVPKEYLKNMPIKFCELIEPNHCGLCGHDFESFQLSRIHYISKNHLKKQKKWIQHFQNDNGSLVPEEKVPLKSRDLYCELCDVHITSKAHSESHYAGRPHRSIVEGRKPPKNPLLLQSNMEGRLEILIRREKRNLKPIEEVEPKTEEEPSKPVPQELFCNICKTSVTCSEQMTMHLNGKKHLNKEKQHILKMMSEQGNINGSKSANENAEGNADETSASANDETINWEQGGGELWDAI